jgi:hypothetical protein
MAATLLQSRAANTGGYTQNATIQWLSNTTTGSTVLISVTYNDDVAGAISTITDSQTNTYYKIAGGASGGDTTTELWYAYNITGGTTPTITVTTDTPANYHDWTLIIKEVAGLTTTDPLDKSVSNATSSGTTHTSNATATLSQANEFVTATLGLAANSTFTLGGGYSDLLQVNGSDLYQALGGESKNVTATTAVTASFTSSATTVGYIIVATFFEASTADLEQEGFAFGDDDDSESAHTLNTQDTNHTGALGTKTLRVLIDTPDDPGAIAYKLKYQKNGSGGYITVPVGSATPGQTGAIVAGDVTESGTNTAGDPWAVAYPNASTGDLLIFHIGWDDSTNVTDLTPPAGPNGESAVVIENVVGSASTAVRGKIVYYIATGTWTASTLSFDPSAREQWTAMCARVPAGEFDTSVPIGAHSNEPSTGTGDAAVTSDLTAGSSDGGGRVMSAIVFDTSVSAGSISGWTPVVSRDRGAVALVLYSRDTLATDSESIAEGTGLGTGVNWVSFSYIVRPPADIPNEIYVSLSGNVAGGGEVTTPRLSAPSGKTTSNFTDGRRWDNENGTDTIDIVSNEYTELEWVLTTQSPATTSDYYDFRVYQGDSALDTYTVTPRWTIGTAGTDDDDERVAETHGQASANAARDAEVTGSAAANNARSAEINGTEGASSARDSEVHGELIDDDVRAAEVTGFLADDSERSAEITGAAGSNDARDSEIHGQATDNNARSAEVHGITENTWEIQRNKDGDGWVTIEEEIDIEDPYDYTDTGPFDNGSEYCYRVRNLYDGTDWSNTVCVNYDAGITEVDARDAETHGIATVTDIREAEITGKEADEAERGAEIHGAATVNDTREAEITGEAMANDARGAEIHGETSDNNARDAEIHGIETVNNAREAQIQGSDEASDTRSGEIMGTASAVDPRAAEVFGIQTLPDSREAEVHGVDTDNDSRGAEITGAEGATASREAELHGEATALSERNAEVTGFALSVDSRSAEVTGSETANAERGAEISGETLAVDSRTAEIAGDDNSGDERWAEVHGIDTVSDTRAGEITGVLGSAESRGA